MISDRDYMREPEGHRPTATTVLLWTLGLCFVVQSISEYYGRIDVAGMLGLSRAGVLSGKVWQLLTFQFLHTTPWPLHVISNCLGLYFFGRTVETVVGMRHYLWLYLGGGVFGGLLQLLVHGLSGYPAGTGVLGASAGVCVLIAVFCRMFPEREACFIFYFFPVRLRAVVFFWILAAFSLWGTLFPGGGIAHAAHLGGLLVGYAYVELLEEGAWRGQWERFSARFRRRPPARVLTPRFTATRIPLAEQVTENDADYIAREVDPILEKIAAHGLQSLTAREQKILQTARDKMTRR